MLYFCLKSCSPKVPLIHVQQPAVKHSRTMPFTLFTGANSSQLSKACIHCAAAADVDGRHVLKTATMHSLLMTNARGDLISQLCHQSKIPEPQ